MLLVTLITHVLVALLSILFSTLLLFRASRKKFYISYFLIFGTLLSGTILVVITHSSLLSSCVAGLSYLFVVSILNYVSYQRWNKKLVKERISLK